MFEYFTNIYASIEELQEVLTAKGKENWRLHTCEKLGFSYFVVMDRIIKINDSESEVSEEQEGMACKG